jgi:hypothetical protein
VTPPARRDGICEVEIDGELVLLDTSSGTLHLLNRAAAAVWSGLDGARDLDEIAGELSDTAGAEAEVVREDVIALVNQLRISDLLS